MKIDYRLTAQEINWAITAYLEKHHGAKAYQVLNIKIEDLGMKNNQPDLVYVATYDTTKSDPARGGIKD